jgi:HK97 gp10 family phage protein
MTSVSFDFQLMGVEEALSKIRKLEDRLQSNAVRAAFRRAANVFKAAGRSKVPVRTGELKKHINTSVSSRGRFKDLNSVITAKVGVTQPKAYHAHLVEDGFNLTSHSGKFIRRISGRPFMRPAFDTNADSALNILVQALKSEAEKRGA